MWDLLLLFISLCEVLQCRIWLLSFIHFCVNLYCPCLSPGHGSAGRYVQVRGLINQKRRLSLQFCSWAPAMMSAFGWLVTASTFTRLCLTQVCIFCSQIIANTLVVSIHWPYQWGLIFPHMYCTWLHVFCVSGNHFLLHCQPSFFTIDWFLHVFIFLSKPLKHLRRG